MMKKQAIFCGVYALASLFASPVWPVEIPLKERIDVTIAKILEQDATSAFRFRAIWDFIPLIEKMDLESARYAKTRLNPVVRDSIAPFQADAITSLSGLVMRLRATITPENRKENIDFLMRYLLNPEFRHPLWLLPSILDIIEEEEGYWQVHADSLSLLGGWLLQTINLERAAKEECQQGEESEIQAKLDSLFILYARVHPKKVQPIEPSLMAIRKMPPFSVDRFEAISAAFNSIAAMEAASARYAKNALNIELRGSFTLQGIRLNRNALENYLSMLAGTVTQENRAENIEYLSSEMISEKAKRLRIPVIRTLLDVLEMEDNYRTEYASRLFLMDVLVEESLSLLAAGTGARGGVTRRVMNKLTLLQHEHILERVRGQSVASTGTVPVLQQRFRGIVGRVVSANMGEADPLSIIDELCSLALLAQGN